MFTEDNEGWLPGNLGGPVPLSETNRSWVVGWMDFTSSADNTSLVMLRNARLGTYVSGSVDVFRCPGDKSVVRIGGTVHPRVRSVAMNGYLGRENPCAKTAGFLDYRKTSDLNRPGPSRLWVLIDENEVTINDGFFYVDTNGYDPMNPRRYVIGDFPVFHGLPCGGLPCSSTPAAPRDLALFGPPVPPPSIRQRRPAARYYFRGSITRLSTSLSTLHAALPNDDARLPYGALATRFPAGLGPAWATVRRFSPCSSFLASAF